MSGDTRSQSTDTELNSVETQIAMIWRDVLQVPEVRLEDNFVELGGDSIAATLCLNRLRRTIDHDVLVSTLLAPEMTLQQFATLVSGASSDSSAEVAS